MKVTLAWIVGHLSLVVIAVLGILLLAGGLVHSCEKDQWRDQYIDALNAAARADSTRIVYQDSLTTIYERYAMILTAKELADLELEEERRLRRKQKLDLIALHELYTSARGQIVGLTEAYGDRDTTRIHIAGRDGPIAMEARLSIASPLVQPQASVQYTMSAVIEDLRIRIRQLEDPETGRVLLQATSPHPQVTGVRLEGAVAIERTRLGQEDGPSRLKWLLLGGAVVEGARLLLGR